MKSHKDKGFDVVVIGGGFFGCAIALFLKKKFKNILIIEKESDLLLKASYNNQARIHNGYHYPRSFITALRSHVNYSKFIKDYTGCVADKYLMIYAIANNSKVTSQQFIKFCKQIGSPLTPAPTEIKQLFDNRLVEEVFVVEEIVFDAGKLRKILKKQLADAGVKILYQKEVFKVGPGGKNVCLDLKTGEKVVSLMALNCTYSRINTILKNSSLPILPFKHELVEMPLLEVPPELHRMGVTIMDGPFFGVMPFPDKGLHTIHHVRYSVRDSVLDSLVTDISDLPNQLSVKDSNFIYMIKDAKRYIPALEGSKYRGSLYEARTVLIKSEVTDARPILFRKDYGIKNFHIVLGGKIDNIYDILEEIRKIL